MSETPIVVGTGLLALDIVISRNSGDNLRVWAGGTCGNVLTILSYLGWDSYPIARLNDDAAAQRIIEDLKNWNVKTDFVKQQPSADTPIIVQQITQNSHGEASHKFSWLCPRCGAWLPSYKAVLVNAAREIANETLRPQVFFFDRVSRGALMLAEQYKSEGAIVYFEPSGVGDAKLFQEALNLAHIVKYAHDRAASFNDFLFEAKPFLQIETLGKNGLRYRICDKNISKKWNEVNSFAASNIVDTAGAGDWFSAGLIYMLGKKGFAGLIGRSERDFTQAFKVAQAMASWNCRFEGARGGMYQTAKSEFYTQIQEILSEGLFHKHQKTIKLKETENHDFACPKCEMVAVNF